MNNRVSHNSMKNIEGLTIHVGDCIESMKKMPAESVNTCVTSPPYFGLRSYFPDGVVLRTDLTDEQQAAIEAELADIGVYPT